MTDMELDHDFEIDESVIEDADWSGAEAEDGRFTECTLRRVDLSGANLLGPSDARRRVAQR